MHYNIGIDFAVIFAYTDSDIHFWQIVERIVEKIDEILLQFVENDGIISVIKDCAWREEYMAA